MLLIDEINNLRSVLYQYLVINDKESIMECSQKLDELIVLYYKENCRIN